MDLFKLKKWTSWLMLWVMLVSNVLTPVTYAKSWDTVSTSSSFTFTMPDWMVSLFAESEANDYTIKFHWNGNTNTSATMSDLSMTFDRSKALSANQFAKQWYTFQWWNTNSWANVALYTDQQSVSNLTTVESWVVDLYAIWKANIYFVKFNQNPWVDTENTIEWSMTDQQFTYDTNTALKQNAFSRSWYTFLWWNRNASATIAEYNDKQTIVSPYLTTTSGEIINLYAIWRAHTTTPYKVEHYKMNVNGQWYTIVSTDTKNLSGTTYSEVTPKVNTYVWFISPEAQTKRIKWDGSLVVVYNYTRNQYDLTFNSDWWEPVNKKTYYYDAQLWTLPTTTKTWWIFAWWKTSNWTLYTWTTHMPAANTTVIAQWEPKPDTIYHVYHYYKKVWVNEYVLATNETETLSWATASILTLKNKAKTWVTWFHYVKWWTSWTTSGPSAQVLTASIAADWSTNLHLYYDRNLHKVTVNTGVWVDSVSWWADNVEYWASVTLGATMNKCYDWAKWTGPTESTTWEYTFIMPDNDVTYTANWTIHQYDLFMNKDKWASTTWTVAQKYDCWSLVTLKWDALTWYAWSKWSIQWLAATTESNEKQFTFTMPNNNVTATAKVTPKEWTKYIVKHMRETLNWEFIDNAENTKTVELTGRTDATITPAFENFPWFAASGSTTTTTINWNGDTVVVYKYNRQSYDLTLQKGRWVSEVVWGWRYKYEQQVNLSAPLLAGYENLQYVGKKTTSSFTMPAEDLTITAQATPIDYTVAYNLNSWSIAGQKREHYTVESGDYTLPTPTRVWYIFNWWTWTELSWPTKTVVITWWSIWNRNYSAVWKADLVKVTVKHYKMDKYGNYPASPTLTTEQYEYSDTEKTPATTSDFWTWFTIPTPNKVYVNPDGSTEAEVYYPRNQYTVTLTAWRGVNSVSTASPSYYYEASVTVTWALKTWYQNLVWNWDYTTSGFTMPYRNVAMTATAIPITYHITYDTAWWTLVTTKNTYTIEDNDITLDQPTRTWYTFDWWTGTDLTEASKTVKIKKWSYGDRSYRAVWHANNVDVTIVHKRMDINGQYPDSLVESWITTEYKADETYTISPKTNYGSGFTIPEEQTKKIAPDWSTVVTFYYPRNKFDVVVLTWRWVASVASSKAKYYYEEPVTVTWTLKSWYRDLVWWGDKTTDSFNMPAENVTMTATATPITYTINYETNGWVISWQTTTYDVETPTFTLVHPSKTGYNFWWWTWSNWTTPNINVQITVGSTGDRTYYAKWNPRNDTHYEIHHMVKNIGNNTYTEDVTYKDVLSWTTDSELIFANLAKNIPCATYGSWSLKSWASWPAQADIVTSTTIKPDGSTNVYLYYTRNKYAVNLSWDSHINTLVWANTYECGATVSVSATTKDWYHFKKWLDQSTNPWTLQNITSN